MDFVRKISVKKYFVRVQIRGLDYTGNELHAYPCFYTRRG